MEERKELSMFSLAIHHLFVPVTVAGLLRELVEMGEAWGGTFHKLLVAEDLLAYAA